MGYVSASRSIGSVEAARVRTVLEQSLAVSDSSDDPEISSILGKTLKKTMSVGFPSSDGENIVASCHRSLHDVVSYRGAASSEDLPSTPIPALVKTISLESVSSATSTSSNSRAAVPSSPSRSIFGRYWKTKKEKKIIFVPESKSTLPLPLEEVRETSEQALPPAPDLCQPSPARSPARQRRSIFGASPSPSSLDLVSNLSQHNRPPLVKASSTSLLLTKRRSCLQRVQRYSSSVGETSSSPPCEGGVRRVRSSSVSFSPEVDVVEYHKACEVHAEEGWSDFFH